MKRIQLLEAEKERLELLHSSTSNGKERDRIKAVLLRSEGWTVPMIAQALRLHERTITRHINDYREEITLLSGWMRCISNVETMTGLFRVLP